MTDLVYIRNTVIDLITKEQKSLASQLLSHYITRAKTIDDFSLINWLALKIPDVELSEKSAESAYALASNSDELFLTRQILYTTYTETNHPDKALQYIKLNLEYNPNCFEILTYYVRILKLNNLQQEAEQLLTKLRSRSDIDENKLIDLDICEKDQFLRRGNLIKGLSIYLNVTKPTQTIFDILEMKKWNEVPIPGQILYVYNQGGVGDEIVNIRFFHHLKQLGMRPILYMDPSRNSIAEVFKRNGIEVIDYDFMIDRRAQWVNLMNLPVHLNLSENQLWYGPYLKSQNIEKNKLSGNKIKIGIKCNGNPYFAHDAFRSIPIEQLLDILPEDCEIYYFDQKSSHPSLINLNDRLSTWEDTFDLLSQMNVVISSCTSLVHAAGSMGIPTIVLTPINQYYVWINSQSKIHTPWYGNNLYICQQQKPKSWQESLLQAKSIITNILLEYEK